MVLKAKKKTPDATPLPCKIKAEAVFEGREAGARSRCWKVFAAREIHSHSLFVGTGPQDRRSSLRTVGRAPPWRNYDLKFSNKGDVGGEMEGNAPAVFVEDQGTNQPQMKQCAKKLSIGFMQGQQSWGLVEGRVPWASPWLACLAHCVPLGQPLHWVRLAGSKYWNFSPWSKMEKEEKKFWPIQPQPSQKSPKLSLQTFQGCLQHALQGDLTNSHFKAVNNSSVFTCHLHVWTLSSPLARPPPCRLFPHLPSTHAGMGREFRPAFDSH